MYAPLDHEAVHARRPIAPYLTELSTTLKFAADGALSVVHGAESGRSGNATAALVLALVLALEEGEEEGGTKQHDGTSARGKASHELQANQHLQVPRPTTRDA